MIITLSSLIQKYNLKITGILHVGAHHGEEINDYLTLGIKNITVFEPIKRNFEILCKNVNSTIVKHQVALGATNMVAPIYVSNNFGLSSSLLKPKKVCEQYTDMRFSQRELVQVVTLDSFNLVGFNFLNMDVQGFELEVLKGGIETLKHVEYIYTEVSRDELYENTVLVHQLDEFLSDFNRVETDWLGDTWGDAFYLRKNVNVF